MIVSITLLADKTTVNDRRDGVTDIKEDFGWLHIYGRGDGYSYAAHYSRSDVLYYVVHGVEEQSHGKETTDGQGREDGQGEDVPEVQEADE